MTESRKLVDITLEEAVEVMVLGEGFQEGAEYQLRVRTSAVGGKKFAQLFYVWDEDESIAANFSDNKDAVSLCQGNKYYRTHYRIIKFLEGRGFDLATADQTY
tara:strand:+ start:629 stop:937 length:309 start_codon:yes stop_codon:yes gene_type:complete